MDEQGLYDTLGANVKHHRHLAGMTQSDLCKMIDLSRGSVANIETGRQRILLHQAFAIALALGVSVNDLVPNFSPKARDIIRLGKSKAVKVAAIDA